MVFFLEKIAQTAYEKLKTRKQQLKIRFWHRCHTPAPPDIVPWRFFYWSWRSKQGTSEQSVTEEEMQWGAGVGGGQCWLSPWWGLCTPVMGYLDEGWPLRMPVRNHHDCVSRYLKKIHFNCGQNYPLDRWYQTLKTEKVCWARPSTLWEFKRECPPPPQAHRF